MIQIVVENDIVNLFKDDKESPIYSIRKAELPLTRQGNGFKTSEWIDHLILKSWMETDTLYELAILIQNEFPENEINWEETFFPVEKKSYLSHVKTTKNLISGKDKSEFTFESLFDTVQTGIDEQNKFVNDQVEKIVKINLEKRGLI